LRAAPETIETKFRFPRNPPETSRRDSSTKRISPAILALQRITEDYRLPEKATMKTYLTLLFSLFAGFSWEDREIDRPLNELSGNVTE
jgi:hypothetical protein